VQATLRRREDHGARQQAEADVEDLLSHLPLRRVVVEEHDALGDGHGARRPREHRSIADELVEAKQRQAVHQDRHVAASDAHAHATLERCMELVAVAPDLRALARLHALLELGLDRGALLEVPGVEALDGVDGGRAHLVAHALGHGVVRDLKIGALRVVEADPVDLLQVAQEHLALAVRLGELRVPGEELGAPRVQLQVDRVAAEVLRELLVLGLALLPARGDERHPALDAVRLGGAAEGRVEALRAQDHPQARGLLCRCCHGHRARTFTMVPMASSMARSVS
jgi:hypothetical protein